MPCKSLKVPVALLNVCDCPGSRCIRGKRGGGQVVLGTSKVPGSLGDTKARHIRLYSFPDVRRIAVISECSKRQRKSPGRARLEAIPRCVKDCADAVFFTLKMLNLLAIAPEVSLVFFPVAILPVVNTESAMTP